MTRFIHVWGSEHTPELILVVRKVLRKINQLLYHEKSIALSLHFTFVKYQNTHASVT